VKRPAALLAGWTVSCFLGAAAQPVQTPYAPVTPGVQLLFPQDFGSHPTFRTEWWYVTGWVATPKGEQLGFQITFFRTKPDIDPKNPSAFAPRQLLVAHCALSDPKRGRLWQDQRIRRAGLGLAEAAEDDANVWIEHWSLKRDGPGYAANIQADDFAFNLELTETQAPLINGESGFSRKGPQPQAASYYYSLPHLKVTGAVSRSGATAQVSGEAWFDHEWSSEYLDAQATGWDWIGINLNDGGALMAFQIRGGGAQKRWAGGTYRSAEGKIEILQPADVDFHAGRSWVSPRTAISYPVEWRVRAGSREFDLKPLMDDQENDTRLSTGAIYWEGAVQAYDHAAQAGRGYLELTGYGERLRLR
jgi:predicted secreted hydrolase